MQNDKNEVKMITVQITPPEQEKLIESIIDELNKPRKCLMSYLTQDGKHGAISCDYPLKHD